MGRTLIREMVEKIKKRGGKQALKTYGILNLIDLGIRFFHLKMASRFYRMRKTTYGLNEAFYYPRAIDEWCRYADIISEIRKLGKAIKTRHTAKIDRSTETPSLVSSKLSGKARNKRLVGSTKSFRILEIGSGGKGVLRFLGPMKYDIVLIDINRNVFLGVQNANIVVCDACSLPFRNEVFDFVISTATLEHIPKNKRGYFLSEANRVCGRIIILHFPLESKNGKFRGYEYDKKFQIAHKRLFGLEDLPTKEHIISGHPTIEEIKEKFPTLKITGRKNCEIWLKYMVFEHTPIVGFLAGLIYYLYWKKKDNKPPYYECMLTYEKETNPPKKRDFHA